MKVRLVSRRLALAGVLSLALPGIALAVKPEPGQFTGPMAIPIFDRKTQELRFAVGGSGRRIAAFDIPTCSDDIGRPLFANRVVRPKVSKSGRIKGALDYERAGSNATVRRFSVRVSGKFVTARRARGRVRVTVTVFRVRFDQPRRQIGEPCKTSGTWKAKHE